MRKSHERRASRAIALVGCAAATLFLAPGAMRAGEMTGALSADKTRVAEGGTVRLALTVAGPASARGRQILQPTLPPMERFELLSTGQRNEAVIAGEGGSFTATFLYTLRAKKAGEERIPAVQVREKGERGEKGEKREDGKEDTELLLTVDGLTLTVEPAGRAVSRGGLVVAVIAGISALALTASCLARGRRRPPSAPAASPPRGGHALSALAAMEDARPLLHSGDWGVYAERIQCAIADYAVREGNGELAALAGSLVALCERVRYARDEEAEREIREGVRRAERILRLKLREGA